MNKHNTGTQGLGVSGLEAGHHRQAKISHRNSSSPRVSLEGPRRGQIFLFN